MYWVFYINLFSLMAMIGQLIRLTSWMISILKKSKELRYTIFNHFRWTLSLNLKIYRKKINDDKNLLFALKHTVYTYSSICGIKITSVGEVVRKIWQNKYKKTWLKICNFFSFLWITSEKAIWNLIKKFQNKVESIFNSLVGWVTLRAACTRRKKNVNVEKKFFSHFWTKMKKKNITKQCFSSLIFVTYYNYENWKKASR